MTTPTKTGVRTPLEDPHRIKHEKSEVSRETPGPGSTLSTHKLVKPRTIVVIDGKATPAVDIDDINRSHLARETRTNLTHISRIFSGERRPTVNQLHAMSVSLSDTYNRRVSMDELFLLLCEINPAMYLNKTHQKGRSQRSGNSEL